MRNWLSSGHKDNISPTVQGRQLAAARGGTPVAALQLRLRALIIAEAIEDAVDDAEE